MSDRAPVPPFTAEHERLRLEIRRFVQDRLHPHADEAPSRSSTPACRSTVSTPRPSWSGLRDARLGPIGGGTDEIMREILGRSTVL